MNGLALFAGVGGMERGLAAAIGPSYRCIGYVEREAQAVAVLVANMERGWLDKAPVWDDVGTFPCELYRGRVDIISAGFPCQPWSYAGRRKGTADERWMRMEWARQLRDSCRASGTAFYFKQDSGGVTEMRPYLVEQDGSRSVIQEWPRALPEQPSAQPSSAGRQSVLPL